MIDEWSSLHSGFARFSDDKSKRYRLARSITMHGRDLMREQGFGRFPLPCVRAVFVMLNPSTADAMKLDPTVSRCLKWATQWGADVLEVANLFALRSPYPEDLYAAANRAEDVGATIENDDAIRAACDRATRVIAAWGRHGRLNHRAEHVTELLLRDGVKLEALRIADDGFPLHPLARGKWFIPYDTEPRRWP